MYSETMSSAVLHLTQLYSKQTYSDPSVAISAKESDDEQSDDNQNDHQTIVIVIVIAIIDFSSFIIDLVIK